MNSAQQKEKSPQTIADIERAAWFARLAFGVHCDREAPAAPRRQMTFCVMP